MGERSDDVKLRPEAAPEATRTTKGNVEVYNEAERYQPPKTKTGDRDLEAIRAEIERTRADMSKTLNAIQDRLSPERLKEQAREKVRQATVGRARNIANTAGRGFREFSFSVVDSIKNNPFPVLLAGVGVGWLLLQSARRSVESEEGYLEERTPYLPEERMYFPEEEYTIKGEEYSPGTVHYQSPELHEGYEADEGPYRAQQKARETMGTVRESAQAGRERTEHLADQARETVARYGEQAREKAGKFASQTRQKAGELTEQARYQVQRARSGFSEMLEDNPLAIAAAAMVLGAVAGFSLPETRREEELMGETRDELMHRVREAGRETMEKVQRVAEEAQHAAKEEAERQNLTGHAVAEKAESVATEATEAAQKEAKEQGLT